MSVDDDRYYDECLADGQVFQDYVARRLYDEGIVLVNFQSRDYQYSHGENLLGLEIKKDRKFAKTGNLWIETEERRAADRPYVASGIYRPDGSWLYGIGNEAELFVFAKKQLCLLCEAYASSYPIRESERRTSRGFLMSRSQAERHVARIFKFRRNAADDTPRRANEIEW